MPPRIQSVLLLVLALAVLVLASQNRSLRDAWLESEGKRAAPEVGDRVVNASWPAASGQPVTFPPLEPARPQVAYVFNSACPYCLQSIPAIRTIASTLAGEGAVDFVGVSLSHPAETQAHVAQHQLSFPVLINERTFWAEASRIRSVPTLVVIGTDLKIAYLHQGAITDEATIAAVLTAARAAR
jgi:peroxiredoxin